jgi:hypothetical protein
MLCAGRLGAMELNFFFACTTVGARFYSPHN